MNYSNRFTIAKKLEDKVNTGTSMIAIDSKTAKEIVEILSVRPEDLIREDAIHHKSINDIQIVEKFDEVKPVYSNKMSLLHLKENIFFPLMSLFYLL